MNHYPYLGPIGLWKTSGKAEACHACHGEIPAGEIFFAFGAEDTHNKAIPPGGTPYHSGCALYVFADGPKPPALFAYPQSREELGIVVPEPELNVPGDWRSARRQWVCRHCAGLIRVGERYFEYTGETHLYEAGRPYHRKCAIESWSAFDTKPTPTAEGGDRTVSEEL